MQGTKTPSGGRMEKKPWEKPGSVGGPVLLWQTNEQSMIMIQAALGQKSDWIGTLYRILSSSIWLKFMGEWKERERRHYGDD